MLRAIRGLAVGHVSRILFQTTWLPNGTHEVQTPQKRQAFCEKDRHWNKHASVKKRHVRSKTWWFACSAIRITYRISLRSSSSQEPRYPLLKVVNNFHAHRVTHCCVYLVTFGLDCIFVWFKVERVVHRDERLVNQRYTEIVGWGFRSRGNDPSAGSPTETLLRLHLPLNDEVYSTSQRYASVRTRATDPKISPNHSIGRCDGRCVQRAGT